MRINTNFRLEATPERVYAVLRLINYKAYTRDEIKQLIHPIEEETDSGIVLGYLTECGLVELNANKKYSLKIDPTHLSSTQNFRKWVNQSIFIQDESATFAFTKWYMGQDVSLLNKSVKQILKDTPDLLRSDRAINAWRLWSKFIGLGTLHNGKFIPNPAIRIKDAIEAYEIFKLGTTLVVGEFIKYLFSVCPELSGCVKDHQISAFLSLALRTLKQEGIIDIYYQQDYTEIWYLHPNSIYDTQITHITIGGSGHE